MFCSESVLWMCCVVLWSVVECCAVLCVYFDCSSHRQLSLLCFTTCHLVVLYNVALGVQVYKCHVSSECCNNNCDEGEATVNDK